MMSMHVGGVGDEVMGSVEKAWCKVGKRWGMVRRHACKMKNRGKDVCEWVWEGMVVCRSFV